MPQRITILTIYNNELVYGFVLLSSNFRLLALSSFPHNFVTFYLLKIVSLTNLTYKRKSQEDIVVSERKLEDTIIYLMILSGVFISTAIAPIDKK